MCDMSGTVLVGKAAAEKRINCHNYGKNLFGVKLVVGKGRDDCALRIGRRRFDPCLMEMDGKTPNWDNCKRFNQKAKKILE